MAAPSPGIVQQALDEAFGDAVKRCFGVLVDGLTDAKTDKERAEAAGRFGFGLRRCLAAYNAAASQAAAATRDGAAS